MGREGWAAAIVGSVGQEWDVERRFRVTEVALAIMWVCGTPILDMYRCISFFGYTTCWCPIAYFNTDYVDSAVHLHIFPISLLIA